MKLKFSLNCLDRSLIAPFEQYIILDDLYFTLPKYRKFTKRIG